MFLTLSAQAGSFSRDFSAVAIAGRMAPDASVDASDDSAGDRTVDDHGTDKEAPFRQAVEPDDRGSAPVQQGRRPFIILASH